MINTITKKDLDLIRFPGGEFKLILKAKINTNTEVKWKYHETFANGEKTLSPSEELVAMMQLEVIFYEYVLDWDGVKHNVWVDHFPFQRQDKAQVLGEVEFDDWVFSRLNINQFASHSEDEWDYRTKRIFKENIPENTLVIFPDESAAKRLNMLGRRVDFDLPNGCAIFTKSRNKEDGTLSFDATPFEAHSWNAKIGYKQIYIVDDIIGYGGTFKHVAKEIKKERTIPITLLVNHSDGVYKMKDLKEAGIDKVIVLDEKGVK